MADHSSVKFWFDQSVAIQEWSKEVKAQYKGNRDWLVKMTLNNFIIAYMSSDTEIANGNEYIYNYMQAYEPQEIYLTTKDKWMALDRQWHNNNVLCGPWEGFCVSTRAIYQIHYHGSVLRCHKCARFRGSFWADRCLSPTHSHHLRVVSGRPHSSLVKAF